MTYWLITFYLDKSFHQISDEEQSELEYTLMEDGAESVYSTSKESINCFFCADTIEGATAFAESHINKTLISFLVSQVVEENWTQQSSELLQPLSVGSLHILPVVDQSAVPANRNSRTLYIIPGMGFGTGHHATTQTVIEFLDIYRHEKKKNKTIIFDFGTGSGILAIASKMLFPESTVIAVDNDSAAVDNARENAQINGITDISFSIEAVPDHHADIILANIYAELLQQFQSDFYQHLSSSGILIISGIMQEKAQLIDASFHHDRWELLKEKSHQGWVSRMYSKKG